jgi:hypothetical protein
MGAIHKDVNIIAAIAMGLIDILVLEC